MGYSTGVILVAVAAVLWSLLGLAIRQIEEAGTWAILFWRSAAMVPALLAFVAWRKRKPILPALRATGWAGLMGGFGLVLAFSGAIFAIQSTTVANAVFLFAASPFLAAALSWAVLRESVRPATWLAIAIAMAGLVVMVREGLALGALAGNLAALASALGFALFTLALRWGRLGDMMPAVAIGGMLSMVVALGTLGLTGEPLLVPARDIAIAMAMGAGLLAVGMALYTMGSQVVPAAELTLITMIESMLAPVWVWLVLGEQASAGTLWGGAIILAAVALNAVSGMRRKPAIPPMA
ncbi:DMT family transporter [Ruegeria pomeroyi]|uniref:DMT family transporter n=1 Tax=Ruegeria pomeroyi TaxID=89184 RepID=A0A9Q3ZLU6_9RHOB|nr:DMT family transporter [Ruegeria pomeroyi]MCE8521288.1 DMT family transporter [Ruegeria pomeroyi]MCE8533331.1 DMT family transporter [Ruegeria pomeroyi]MCE8537388.1 DMT family transporter [Ruegeria pomeroyi]